jgi:hypothetical protein
MSGGGGRVCVRACVRAWVRALVVGGLEEERGQMDGEQPEERAHLLVSG